MRNIKNDWPRLATTGVAGLQALALIGYAVGIALVAMISGIDGPAEVSSPTGTVVEVITFGLFGVGMALIAVGRWRGSQWTGAPFVLAQLLALAVGFPLLTAIDPTGRILGFTVTASAVIGLVGMVAGVLKTPDDVDLTTGQRASEGADHTTPRQV